LLFGAKFLKNGLTQSLGLLFGINNILNLGWGTSITYLYKKTKEKKMKKI